MAIVIGLLRLQFDCLVFAFFAFHFTKMWIKKSNCTFHKRLATIYECDLRDNISNAMINKGGEDGKMA